MITYIRKVVLILLGGAALAAPVCNAQLLISGNLYGVFIDEAVPNTTIVNGPVVSTFASGTPYRPYAPFNDTSTSIKFTGASFNDVGNGAPIVLDSIVFKNGITLLGSTGSHASMDLFVNVSNLGISGLKLTTLMFDLDNTANNGVQDVPDIFKVSHLPLEQIVTEDYLVTFSLVFTDEAWVTTGKSIPENKTGKTGDIYVNMTFTPIPEPSTYALAGAGLLGGVVLLRRARRSAMAAA